MNYLNYINHVLYTPDIFYRRFEFDLGAIQDTAKRTLLAALPFIGLNRAISTPLSVGMNSMRTVSHLQDALSAEDRGAWRQCIISLGETALAAISLAMTFFSFTPGLFLNTGVDTLRGVKNLVDSLYAKETEKVVEEALQVLSSMAYLSFIATGGLEAMLCFTLLQATHSLLQARCEVFKGHWIEGVSKLAMACMRFKQAGHYIQLIERRNALLQMKKTQDLLLKILRGRQATHLINHPLSSLQQRIEERDVILTDADGIEHHFGAHFSGNGQALVKGENLTFRKKTIDGKEIVELDFKINHAFREKIAESISLLKKMDPKLMREVLEVGGSHVHGILVEQDSFFKRKNDSFFSTVNIGEACKIQFHGLGEILIGSDSNQPNLYDRVVVHIDANKTLYSLHEMLALLDLDQALFLSTKDDIERLKIGHLFRTFFPREAFKLERTKEFFSLPIDVLKKRIIDLCPDMEEIFTSYLHRIKAEFLFDGRVRYRIEGLAQQAYAAGARALTAAVTGVRSEKELFERVASMLRMGIIATEVRDENGLEKHGLGGFGIDYLSGGADSIYTQLITEKNCKEKMELNELHYQSRVRLLFYLDALELGSYQYHTDNLGSRMTNTQWWPLEKYENRESILEFIRNEQNCCGLNGGHEIMMKERLSPSFFKGLIVSDEKTKASLITYLLQCGIIQNGNILNIPVDRFIRVGGVVTEELIS